VYDLDGNLTQDGRWSYTWDGENRLIKMVSRTGAPAQYIQFTYDWQGRRISKKVWNNTDGSGAPVVNERYLYDGWNLIAVIDGSAATLLKSFVWGTDLSGTLQGAGGVGGLLKVRQHSPSAANAYVAYDGNGNVVGLVNTADGKFSARYEYGPFGEVVRATGPMAKANPFRFSTKYQDDETDLLYYGHRYYNASTGRWISRDPLDEKSEPNLYGFVRQDAVSKVDVDGREIGQVCSTCGQYYVGTHVCLGPPVPLGTNEVGFEMCRRNVFEDDWKDRAANNCCGGLHMFVRQKYFDGDGNPIYRGWGFDKSGPHQEADALGKFLPTCASCKKSPRKLMYGDGKDTPGDKATDEQIWDCLTKVPASFEYNTLFYNCQSYAWQAASKCGLDCRNPGPPPGRK
jgi:RHS repeat-associated protein